MHGMCHHFQHYQLAQGTGVLSRPIIILLNQDYEITPPKRGVEGKGYRGGQKPKTHKTLKYWFRTCSSTGSELHCCGDRMRKILKT